VAEGRVGLPRGLGHRPVCCRHPTSTISPRRVNDGRLSSCDWAALAPGRTATNHMGWSGVPGVAHPTEFPLGCTGLSDLQVSPQAKTPRGCAQLLSGRLNTSAHTSATPATPATPSSCSSCAPVKAAEGCSRALVRVCCWGVRAGGRCSIAAACLGPGLHPRTRRQGFDVESDLRNEPQPASCAGCGRAWWQGGGGRPQSPGDGTEEHAGGRTCTPAVAIWPTTGAP